MQEYEVDYTSCERHDYTNDSSTPARCSEFIEGNFNKNCICHINFTLENDFKRDVFVYYGLTNFYQNHRRYVKSRDDYQLLGNIFSDSQCAPFQKRIDPLDGEEKTIMPCGAIANSLFNDTFHLERYSQDSTTGYSTGFRTVPFHETGIAWATDKKNKFRNPVLSKGQTSLSQAFNGTIQPINWPKPIYDLDKTDTSDNGLQNEGFIVWMRTAAFPTFRKVYARIAHDKHDNNVDYQYGLPKGLYKLTINYSK